MARKLFVIQNAETDIKLSIGAAVLRVGVRQFKGGGLTGHAARGRHRMQGEFFISSFETLTFCNRWGPHTTSYIGVQFSLLHLGFKHLPTPSLSRQHFRSGSKYNPT